MMKTRAAAAKLINAQLSGVEVIPDKQAHHYGKCELRQLMDFIFDGPPTRADQYIGELPRLRNAKVGKWRD